MSRNRRRSHDRKPTAKTAAAAPLETGAACPSCKAAVGPEDRFCRGCGAALRAAPAARRASRSKTAVAAFYAAAAAVAAVAIAAIFVFGPDRGETPPQAVAPTAPQGPSSAMAPAAAPPASSPTPPPGLDVAAMSPREAADRLFNRVMMASERGNMVEALQFAPMALEAYERVVDLDADAHYHLGLIHEVAGDIENTRKQIEILRGYAANHLLAFILEYRIAELSGDGEAAARAAAAFAAAYDAEIVTGRPEYEAHRNSIEIFRTEASRPKSEGTPAAPPAAVAGGGALFAANCARCHGPEAAGSKSGPPLVHRIYVPGHHPDEAFLRAVRQGVRSHHWSFGDMPAIAGVTDEQVGRIVDYIRALQVANGIQ